MQKANVFLYTSNEQMHTKTKSITLFKSITKSINLFKITQNSAVKKKKQSNFKKGKRQEDTFHLRGYADDQ